MVTHVPKHSYNDCYFGTEQKLWFAEWQIQEGRIIGKIMAPDEGDKKDRVEVFKKWITSVFTQALKLCYLLNKLHWLRWSKCSFNQWETSLKMFSVVDDLFLHTEITYQIVLTILFEGAAGQLSCLKLRTVENCSRRTMCWVAAWTDPLVLWQKVASGMYCFLFIAKSAARKLRDMNFL